MRRAATDVRLGDAVRRHASLLRGGQLPLVPALIAATRCLLQPPPPLPPLPTPPSPPLTGELAKESEPAEKLTPTRCAYAALLLRELPEV